MSAFEIESGEIVHCIELSSDGELTGTFELNKDGIRTKITATRSVSSSSRKSQFSSLLRIISPYRCTQIFQPRRVLIHA